MKTSIWLACIATLIAMAAVTAVAQQQEERKSKNLVGKTEDGKPKIQYGMARSSGRWIKTRNARVAVDDGIEWNGRKYYITLTYSLLAVEGEKTAWHKNISAFWDQMQISSYGEENSKVDALALRSSRNPGFVEYRSLDTGRIIGRDGAESPGTPLALLGSWRGAKSSSDERHIELVEDAASWQQLHKKLFSGVATTPPTEWDFAKSVLVVVAEGKRSNCNGYSASAYEDGNVIRVRANAHTYQSMGETPATWAWGVFAVPRKSGKQLVLERNTQNMINGPEIWREWQRWTVR